MKFNIITLYIKPLMLLAGFIVCTGSIANEAEQSTDTSQIAASSEASSTTAVDSQEVKKSFENPNAMLVEMAFKFKNSEGTPRDYAEVAAKYCSAAKTGDADALYALGWMYANGRGVPVDQSIAAQLYAKAAEQKHVRAMESLAELSTTAPKSALPTCLLPDPPKMIVTIRNEPERNETEKKAISDKTAALFYSQGHILKLVDKLAPRYKIDSNLVMAFIAVESGFNVQATSPKNAQGLMQLIPATARRFNVKNAYKAEDNIKGGLAYLQWLLAYFEGDVELVAAAYNSGERAVDKYKGVPPYAETRTYVKKIARLYNKASHPYREDLVKASPIVSLAKKRAI
ncbi:MAG TPA: transglycosylase SLT domain-containing protein [Methylotenera sp.]|nr:transglycosylase SLT domain-containing protein [Methylotenera sp.]